MRKAFLAVSIFSILFISCQREVDDIFSGNGNNGSSNGSGQLVKMLTRSGSDSTLVDFGYTSNGKLAFANTMGVESGTAFNSQVRLVRNSQGIITQVITKSSDLSQYGLDSIITQANYNAAASRYTSRVTSVSVFGITLKDSVAFNYDASGKIVMLEDFQQSLTGAYEPSAKFEYTYSGNNITVMKAYGYDATTMTYSLQSTRTTTYDNKPAAIVLGNEAFVIDAINLYSANNATKAVTVDPTDPTQNETQDVSYTYNSSNKPATSTTVIQGGPTATTTYTYN